MSDLPICTKNETGNESKTLRLNIVSLTCEDETEHEGFWPFQGEGIANDAMRLIAIVTQTLNDGSPSQCRTSLIDLGSDYEDGRTFTMDKELIRISLTEEHYPYFVNVLFMLVEEDWGGLNWDQFVKDVVNLVGGAVKSFISSTTSSAIGSTLGSALGPVGTGIGAAIGAVVGEIIGAIDDAILNTESDIFPLQDISLRIESQDSFFNGDNASIRRQFLRFNGHGGRYLLAYDWQISEEAICFYEGSTGTAEVYEISSNGDLGRKSHYINGGWRKTWTSIEHLRAEGKDLMLFYEKSTGTAEVYEVSNDGDLGRKLYHINGGWRKTWTSIEFFKSGNKDLLLFYERSTGSAFIYEIETNGYLGRRLHSINNGWRKTWSIIEYYRFTDSNKNRKDMMLFYEASTGSAELYEIKNNGSLGKKMRYIEGGWRKSWTSIEYYRSGGVDMLLFYEASTGSAEMYEIKSNGDLGKKVHHINGGWRKTWTSIAVMNFNLIN